MLKPQEMQVVIDEVVTRLVNQYSLTPQNSSETLHDRVITTAQVTAVGPSVGVVMVRSDAVITPAAKDLFRERGVVLRRESVQGTEALDSSLMASLFMVECDDQIPSGVRSLLGNPRRFDCVIKASQEIAGLCEEGQRIVLMTKVPEVAVVALSRISTIRPVEVLSLEKPGVVEQRCEATAANVLVVSSRAGVAWQLPRVIKVFLNQQYAAIPAWL